METPGHAQGRTERRQAAGLRQALLLSSAGHLLALAAGFLLGPGAPTASVPAAVNVVLVAAGGPGRADSLGAPAPAGPVRPEEFLFPTERAGEEVPAAKSLPPEGSPSPVMEKPTGAAPAETVDVAAEIRRGGDPESSVEAGGSRRRVAFAGIGETDGERGGTAASDAVSGTSAPLVEASGSEGTGGGGDGAAAARLRDAIQSRIVYPDEAVRRGLEGEVLLRIRIGRGGDPGEIRVARSSGARILDEAARRGVVRAAPLPSAPGWVDVPVRFSLRRPAGERP